MLSASSTQLGCDWGVKTIWQRTEVCSINLKQRLPYRGVGTTGVPVSLCPVNDCPIPRVRLTLSWKESYMLSLSLEFVEVVVISKQEHRNFLEWKWTRVNLYQVASQKRPTPALIIYSSSSVSTWVKKARARLLRCPICHVCEEWWWIAQQTGQGHLLVSTSLSIRLTNCAFSLDIGAIVNRQL